MKKNHPAVKFFAIVTALLCVFVSACKAEIDNPKVYYTVSYETAHGTAPETIKVLSGTVLTAAELPELTEDGFIFDGWYIGSSKITSELGYTVNSNIKLTAKWTEITVTPPAPEPVYYTITYESEYGQVPQSKKVLSGTKLTAADLPELSEHGYIFDGWYIGQTKITADYEVKSDITLTAKWSEDIVFCTITYVSAYGTAPQSKKVPIETVLTADDLPAITAEGHIFNGWYIGNIQISAGYKITSDITLSAWWGTETPPPVSFTISYQSEYGNAPALITVDSGTVLTDEKLPTLSCDGYKFEGWYLNNINITVEDNYQVLSNITLIAKWTPEYTITYQTLYGTTPDSKTVIQGTELKASDLPELSYTGYEFGGWYIDQQKINAGYKVNSNITLVAKWTPYFTVTYTTQYETGSAPEQKTVLQGTALTANDLPDLLHTGYDFDGWYIGQSKITAGYQVMDNITLTARWTAVYTITFTTVRGATPPAKTVRDGTSLSAADLAAPSYNGTDFEFDGWYNGSTKIQAGTTVTSSMTLTANWIRYYTVSYSNPFGTAPALKRVPEGTQLTAADLPDNYTTTGYTFDGWYLDTQKITAGYEVTSNITLMATWLKTYTVTYVSERGEVPRSQDFVDKTVLGSNDLQPLTANGYTFDGWYAGNTKITGSYQVTGNVTLTGKWNYTISYSTEHGTIPTSKPVLSGYKLTQTDLPTLSDSDGYRFTGWKIGSQAVAVNYTVADNITLTAQWVAIPSGVSLFVEAGSSVTEDELNFAVSSEKSGDNYILTATSGYDVYLWSVDEINLYDEEYFYYDVNTVEDDLYYGNIPTEITSNTLTFNENTLPSGVSADGTYVVYVQAFKKIATDMVGNHNQTIYVYERAGIVFTVIRM